MTRDDIIRMAQEAGFSQRHNNPNEWWMLTGDIERFAALVAAAEREACANLWEASKLTDKQISEQIKAAVQAEREACAQVCDKYETFFEKYYTRGWAELCAATIRARGDK